jgi:hypothetical protein
LTCEKRVVKVAAVSNMDIKTNFNVGSIYGLVPDEAYSLYKITLAMLRKRRYP